jgi:hypothetical protein
VLGRGCCRRCRRRLHKSGRESREQAHRRRTLAASSMLPAASGRRWPEAGTPPFPAIVDRREMVTSRAAVGQMVTPRAASGRSMLHARYLASCGRPVVGATGGLDLGVRLAWCCRLEQPFAPEICSHRRGWCLLAMRFAAVFFVYPLLYHQIQVPWMKQRVAIGSIVDFVNN